MAADVSGGGVGEGAFGGGGPEGVEAQAVVGDDRGGLIGGPCAPARSPVGEGEEVGEVDFGWGDGEGLPVNDDEADRRSR